jgi:hypothetical protein
VLFEQLWIVHCCFSNIANWQKHDSMKEARQHEDSEARQHGDSEARQHEDSEARQHEDSEARQHGDSEYRILFIIAS